MANRKNFKKYFLARLFARTGSSKIMLNYLRIHHGQSYIRAIHYHSTPPEYRENFDRHLEFYSRNFVPAGPTELETLLSGKTWPHPKPGLIISFDDGMKDNFDVATPLLEKHGFTGWFMIPTGFVDCAAHEQGTHAQQHLISTAHRMHTERIAMTWDELSVLSRRHVIGCHTHNHHRLNAATNPSQLREEIFVSKQLLENRLGKDVNVFCWVGGEESSYSAEAARLIKEAGYIWSFMTNSQPITQRANPLQLQRTNIEAGWPLEVVLFQLSGFMDLWYINKRRRVNRLTNV